MKPYKILKEDSDLVVFEGRDGVVTEFFIEQTNHVLIDPEITYSVIRDYALQKGELCSITLEEVEKQLLAKEIIEVIRRSATKRMWRLKAPANTIRMVVHDEVSPK